MKMIHYNSLINDSLINSAIYYKIKIEMSYLPLELIVPNIEFRNIRDLLTKISYENPYSIMIQSQSKLNQGNNHVFH